MRQKKKAPRESHTDEIEEESRGRETQMRNKKTNITIRRLHGKRDTDETEEDCRERDTDETEED